MPTASHTPKSSAIPQMVRRIISTRKGVRQLRLRATTHLSRELGFDTVGSIYLILALERYFHLEILDGVPLHTVGDFVHVMGAQHRRRQQVG